MAKAVWERRRFLIVVKTYPNPSASLAEVVCTAAVDEQGRLTRLFPIPFRTMKDEARFKKWQWIEANVTKAPSDARPESYKVDVSSIECIGSPMPAGKGWGDRWKHVEHLLSPSMCELSQRKDVSLGLIKPLDYSLTFEDQTNPKWTTKELEKLFGQPGTNDLFGEVTAPKTLLTKCPVRIRYRFRCDDAACLGHEKLFEDWEVGEAYRSWRSRYKTRDELETAIEEKFAGEPRRYDNLFLWVGTMAAHPDTWIVIGHMQPLHLRNKVIPSVPRAR